MASKSASEWVQTPNLPKTHFVDTSIYTDQEIFDEEREKIFNKAWWVACHESEVPNPGDYRLFHHPGGEELIIIRSDDGEVRSFYNICPHRGNTLIYTPAGNIGKCITCIFHAWSFNSRGDCIDITREEQGYQDRMSKEQLGMRRVRTEVAYGGMVWVNVDDEAMTLEEFVGRAIPDEFPTQFNEPMEVFHYHRAIVDTNYKLWHDTNSEFYHDYMHYHNRKTGMIQPGYFDRKYTPYPNGHASVGSMQVRYDAYEGAEERGVGWPDLEPGGWVMVDLFPGMTYNLRTSVLRMDTVIPLGPNKTMIEYRGLGLKKDTEAERAERIRDHNLIWGPLGRNLHEDLLGVFGQGQAMRKGTDSRWVLHGREENDTIHDEIGMRHFYETWSQWMGRHSYDPYGRLEQSEKEQAKATAAV